MDGHWSSWTIQAVSLFLSQFTSNLTNFLLIPVGMLNEFQNTLPNINKITSYHFKLAHEIILSYHRPDINFRCSLLVFFFTATSLCIIQHTNAWNDLVGVDIIIANLCKTQTRTIESDLIDMIILYNIPYN
jgi:hypothetical protein